MSKIKAVVTGGAGFIGSHIVDALLERGFDVHIIDNMSAGREENVNTAAFLHKVDIRDLASIKEAMKDAAYVFHAAAVPRVPYSIENPIDSHDNNINGTLNVLLAARDAGVKKVIYSASSSAYGEQSIMPLHEDMTPNPISPYGLQKHVGEIKCRVFSRVYGLPTVSLRYFNVYGPRLDPNGAYALVIGRFLKQRSEEKPLTVTGDGEQTRDFTHVRDVAMANIMAMESDKVGKGEVLNIGAGSNLSIKRIAEMIGGPIEFVEARLEPKHTLADNRKAKDLIGWHPRVSIEEGITELKKIWKIS